MYEPKFSDECLKKPMFFMSFPFMVTEEIGSPASTCYIHTSFLSFGHSVNVYGTITWPGTSPVLVIQQ